MYQAGLVLEGGGMKGIYTAGVLEFFLEKGIDYLDTRKYCSGDGYYHRQTCVFAIARYAQGH